MAKFLDLEGLNYFWAKIKSWVLEHFAYKSDLNQKLNTLISGQNIKTINNESVLGSGNIEIQGGGDVNSVNGKTGNVILTAEDVGALSSFTETDPTVPSWAKQNSKPSYTQDEISEGETNKSYTVTEKNKLSGIADGAEVNVLANWNESNASSDAYILNKPKVLNNIVGITTPTADEDYITVTANTPITGMASIDYFLINFASIGSGNDSKKVKILFTGESTAIPLYNATGTTEIVVSDLGTDWWLIDVVKTNNKCYLKENFNSSSGGGGEENIIESISVNGTTLTINNKNVDITVPTVPTNVSAFNNDAGYLTSHQDISEKENTSNKVTSFQSTPDDTHYPSEKLVKDSLDVKQDIIDSSHKLSADYIQDGTTNKVINVKPDWNAASGADAEILNKPTIPVAGIPSGGNAGQVLKKVSADPYDVTWANQSETLPSAYCTTSGSTAAKKANCSLYVTQANLYLQVLIGSANTYQGALTLNINSAGAKPIYINGTVSSSTNYTLPNGTYFVFYDGTNYYFRTDGKIQGPSGTFYIKPSGGIPASDLASGVIPTVPVQDVTVGGTSVVSNGIAMIPAIPDVSGKADKVLVATTEPSGGMLPNVLYEFGELSGNTTFTLATPSDNTIANHYYFTFDTPSTAPTITWPTGLTWFGGSAPTISASKHYEISVLDGIAIAMEV